MEFWKKFRFKIHVLTSIPCSLNADPEHNPYTPKKKIEEEHLAHVDAHEYHGHDYEQGYGHDGHVQGYEHGGHDGHNHGFLIHA